VRIDGKKASVCSGMKDVPSQPSATSPVYSRDFGPRVAR